MKKFRIHGALFLVSAFYAVLFSWAGNVMPEYLSPMAFVFLRIFTATILFFLSVKIFTKSVKVDWKKDWKLFAVCGFFGTSMNMALFFVGLSMTRPINGAVLMMVTPLFVAVFDHIKNRRKPGPDTTAGLLLATVGAGLLIAGKGVSFTSATLTGDLLIAINAALYAVYLVLVKGLLSKYPSMQVNSICFFAGLIFTAPLGLWPLLTTDFSVIPTDIWLKIIYILIFTTAIVYQLNAYAVQNASPQLVGAYIYLQPLLATLIAIAFGADSLSLQKTVYILLILAGVWLVVGNKGQILKKLLAGSA